MNAECPRFPVCGGCDDLGRAEGEQKAAQVERVTGLLRERGVTAVPTPGFVRPGTWAARDRLDFLWADGKLGLYARDRAGGLVDLPECPQLSAPLAAWLADFRRNPPPVARGSVRLRVAPDGRRGLWLDFANVDIKAVLDERAWLESWPADVVVEMGQRRKIVARTPAGPKLKDPLLHPWFRTLWRDEAVSLYGAVGSFTQPSLRANGVIARWFRDRVLRAAPGTIVEFGSGNGNLSFPALSGEASLIACENEPVSTAGFRRGLDELAARGFDLRPRVTFETGDFQRGPVARLEDADLLIANPPRSGLKRFLDPLDGTRGPATVLYMSCHAESFAEDAGRLTRAGYAPAEITLLDQFPQTKHVEILSEWRRG